MCRLMAFIGEPILLADVVLYPDRSIIKQSYDARERLQDPSLPAHVGFGNLNGDGFGIGWFNPDEQRDRDPTPCVFTSVTPAWNNDNLARLGSKIISPLMFAHVRAAYPGMPVSEQNCHPFSFGRYLWMHNGVIGAFSKVKRGLLETLSDCAYNTIQSFHSDSSVSFALFLNHLPDMTSQHPPEVLLKAMQDAIATVMRVQKVCGVTALTLLNFVVSDGITLLSSRFVSPSEAKAATLYYAEGAAFERVDSVDKTPTCRSATGAGSSITHEGKYELVYGERGPVVALVASEPITGSSSDWVAVPKNNMLVITREKGGYLNILHSPISVGADDCELAAKELAQKEVSLCLEAMSRGLCAKSRAWLPPRFSGAGSLIAEPSKIPLSPTSLLASRSGSLILHPSPKAVGQNGMAYFSPTQLGVASISPTLFDLHFSDSTFNKGMMADGSAPRVLNPNPSPPPIFQRISGTGSSFLEMSGRPLSSSPMNTEYTLDPNLSSMMEMNSAHNHMRLSGHTGPVLCTVVDEGAQRLYSASSDLTIKIWSLEHNSLIGSLSSPSKPVTRMVMYKRWLLASAGRKLRIWDTVSLRCVQVLHIDGDGVGSIKAIQALAPCPLSPNCLRLYLGCQDTTIKAFQLDMTIWEAAVDSPPPQQTHSQPVSSAAAAAAGGAAAGAAGAGSGGGATASGGGATAGGGGSGAAAAGGATLFAGGAAAAGGGSGGGAAGVFVSALTMEPQASMPLPTSIAFGGSGNPCADASMVTAELKGHAGPINALTVWGPYLISAGGDSMMRVWRLSDLSPVRVLRGHRGSVLCLTTMGGLLISGSRDNTIRVWDMDMDMICRRTLTGHKDDVLCLDVMMLRGVGNSLKHMSKAAGEPDAVRNRLTACSVMLSGSADGTIRLWSHTWSCICVMSLPIGLYVPPSMLPLDTPRPKVPAATSALCVALTTSKVAVGYSDGAIRMWHCEDVHVAALKLAAAGLAEMDPSLLDEAAFEFNASNGDIIERTASNGIERQPKHRQVSRTDLARALNNVVKGSSFTPVELAVYSRVLSCPKISLHLLLSTDQQLENSLREFVRIKTVSSNPNLRDECFKGARFVSKLLEGLGAEIKVVRPHDNKNPLVFGRIGHDPRRPTITFYAHYDVQPATESEWNSDPFELHAVNEYLYGRGTSDNKGPLLAFIYGVKELLQGLKKQEGCNGYDDDDEEHQEEGCNNAVPSVGAIATESGGLPVNLAFIFEGEEENGSVGTREMVAQNLRWFEGTDAIIISNTNWIGESAPCLTYGMRGMIGLSVVVTGPQRDIHSGNDGGVFNEPMTDLVKVMSTLLSPNSNEILVPGFNSGIESDLIDLAWSSLAQTLDRPEGDEQAAEFSMTGYQTALGVPALTDTAGASVKELLKSRWCRPSMSVVDMRPSAGRPELGAATNCYRFGPTRFSVVPKTATGKVSIRFVPKQDAVELIACFRSYVESEFTKLGSGNTLEVFVEAQGNWWEADQSSKYMQMAASAVQREWGAEPLYVREGGTMPVACSLEKVLNAPAIMIPMGQASDAPHLANERIRRTNLFKGKNVIVEFLKDVAKEPSKALSI